MREGGWYTNNERETGGGVNKEWRQTVKSLTLIGRW